MARDKLIGFKTPEPLATDSILFIVLGLMLAFYGHSGFPILKCPNRIIGQKTRAICYGKLSYHFQRRKIYGNNK